MPPSKFFSPSLDKVNGKVSKYDVLEVLDQPRFMKLAAYQEGDEKGDGSGLSNTEVKSKIPNCRCVAVLSGLVPSEELKGLGLLSDGEEETLMSK